MLQVVVVDKGDTKYSNIEGVLPTVAEGVQKQDVRDVPLADDDIPF